MLKEATDSKNLIEILGLEDLPIEQQKNIIVIATEIVETRVLNKVLEYFSEEEIETFKGFLIQKNNDGIANMLRDKNIDILDMANGEILEFKKEMATEQWGE